jgi:tetratricopeptide (TPR) repeat protein
VVEHQAPHLPRLSFERALVLEALGNYRGAEAELTRHLSEKQPLSAAWAARARIREKRKKPAGAIADYSQAIALGATPDLALARGKLQTQLGKHADAARGYRAVLPKLGGAVVVRLAWIEAERNLGRYKQALEQVNALLQNAPDTRTTCCYAPTFISRPNSPRVPSGTAGGPSQQRRRSLRPRTPRCRASVSPRHCTRWVRPSRPSANLPERCNSRVVCPRPTP